MSMGQGERLDWLLRYLLEERKGQGGIAVPESYNGKRALFRALVNMRPPRPALEGFIKVQDDFLSEEARQKGIVKTEGLVPCPADGRIVLWQGDITRLAADAIVNAANSGLLGCFVPGHHCIDNAIHTAAGIQLRGECHAIMEAQGCPEKTGSAKITGGYNLPAKHVVHTVGPIIQGSPTDRQIQELAQCYQSCLELAARNGINTIAFCGISTGVFAFPKPLAAEIAVHTVSSFLQQSTSIHRVVFNVFAEEDFTIYNDLLRAD